MNPDIIDVVFEEVDMVEVYGERMIFDKRVCDKFNRIVGLCAFVMLVLTVVKVY